MGHIFQKEKLQKVISITPPKTMKGLKSFLGLANYFRDHIKGHSMLVAPLTRMILGYNPRTVLEWTAETVKAFEDTKEAINSCPALFFMDQTSSVHLFTDASNIGIGGYLCQIKEEKEYPIAFYSKTLTKAEQKWGTPCLEGFAIHQAFRHFRYLLRDAHTIVHTDHKNLTYIRESNDDKVIRWKIELQEYSFELHYIPGPKNEIADFWSRNEAAEEDDYVIDTPAKAVNMLCYMQEIEPEESQGGDLEVSQEDDTEDMDGMRGEHATLNVIVIPDDRYAEITAVHNNMAGHHGVELTLDKLARQGKTWRYMREHVRKFIRECDSCQKASYNRHKVRIPKFTAGSYQPMERVNIDTIGPLPTDELGNKYIIAIIDCFSRFLTTFPSANVTKREAADALLIHCGYFGIPSTLVSDRGSQYANDIIKEFMSLAGVEHILTMAYSKEENAIVERSNRETMKWIRQMLADPRVEKKSWSKYLPLATRIHNASKCESIGYAPAEVIFGDRVNLDKNILLPPSARVENAPEITDWMKDRCLAQSNIVEVAREKQTQHHDRHVTLTEEEAEQPLTEYEIGSYVLAAYPDTNYGLPRPDKLHMMLTGPYLIIGRQGQEYQLRGLISQRLVTKSVFLLRPYRYDAARVDPVEMARNDHDVNYDVEYIVSHTGQWSRVAQMTFTVKWEGFEEPTPGQLWKDLRTNEKLHDYLRQNNKERLIPEQFRQGEV